MAFLETGPLAHAKEHRSEIWRQTLVDALLAMVDPAILGQRVARDFVPTSRRVADYMIDVLRPRKGAKVLEPSAGKGDILKTLRTRGIVAEAIEKDPARRKILEAAGFPVVGKDFLKYKHPVDYIIMNPPFSKGQAREHLFHAYDLLKPKGRVVAYMPYWQIARKRPGEQAVVDWIKERGKIHKQMQLPTGGGRKISGYVVELEK